MVAWGGAGLRKQPKVEEKVVIPDEETLNVCEVPSSVEVNSLAILRMFKAAREVCPSVGFGSLLGMDMPRGDDMVLEVADVIPHLPVTGEDATQADAQNEFNVRMMTSLLKDVKQDSIVVGWYVISSGQHYLTSQLVSTQFEYQSLVPGSVVLVMDPLRLVAGTKGALKAIRLSEDFMNIARELQEDAKHDVHLKKEVTSQSCWVASALQRLSRVGKSAMIDVPLHLQNSVLMEAYLLEEASKVDSFLQANLRPSWECMSMSTAMNVLSEPLHEAHGKGHKGAHAHKA